MDQWINFLMLFGTGCVAGTLNVVAGGGSFLTLPMLIFLGLPPRLANGTNRVAILAQNIGAVWGFHRHGVMDWKSLLWGALPAAGGAALGALIALLISDQTFKNILAFLMISVTLWTLWNPFGQRINETQKPRFPKWMIITGGFFAIGVYSGFVQAGVGFLILAVTTMVGLDLVKGNAVKVLVLLASMIISLTIFAAQDQVNWLLGVVLGIGNSIGGLIGVRLTVLKGHAWIKNIVTVTVILFAFKLFFE